MIFKVDLIGHARLWFSVSNDLERVKASSDC